ncbi:hypothetical protein ISCGN_027232 [Ixodes scapularis]
MGNLAIVLLLVCTVSSCVARPRNSFYPDGENPYRHGGPIEIGKPCKDQAECPFYLVCNTGSCQPKPLTDDEILDVLFNGDSEIEDFDDSDADLTFSSEGEIDYSDDKPDDDAPRDAPEGFFKALLKVKNNVKVVDDDDVPEETKKTDACWKVRPFLSRLRQHCLATPRVEYASIDEEMIPFYGKTKMRMQTGGGGGRVRSLASSYARILTLVGEDSALGAPGFSVPAFEDEAEAGHGQQAAEPVPSTSRDVRPPARPRVRPTAPRATPRMSRQERRDEAAMQAVANQTLQLQENETRDARDIEFQGQLLRSIETLSHRMEAVAESNQEQARATQAVALELQNTTRVLVEVVMLLTAERSRAL